MDESVKKEHGEKEGSTRKGVRTQSRDQCAYYDLHDRLLFIFRYP